MKRDATELGINLLFISPRLKDEVQPLGHSMSWVMKANCRRLHPPMLQGWGNEQGGRIRSFGASMGTGQS
jgi:hypothetical protein